MASVFDITAADRAKDQIFPASIVDLELRENGGGSDQYNSYGDIEGGTLSIEERSQDVAGGAKRQFGVMITLTGNIVATGTNIRTALANISDYVVDVRVTTIDGNTYVFAQEDTGIRGDLTIGETLENSNDVDGGVLIPFEWRGYASMAKWLAAYTAAS